MLQTLASPLNVRVVQEAATHVGSEYVLTLGAHAQRGLRYLLCVSVCLCVCVCVSVCYRSSSYSVRFSLQRTAPVALS